MNNPEPIDLGAELANYDDSDPPPQLTIGDTRRSAPRARLSDLQAQGFNRTPGHPSQIPPMWRKSDDQRGLDFEDLINVNDDPWRPGFGGSTGSPWSALADAAVGHNPPGWNITRHAISQSNDRCTQCQRYLPNATTPTLCAECVHMRGDPP